MERFDLYIRSLLSLKQFSSERLNLNFFEKLFRNFLIFSIGELDTEEISGTSEEEDTGWVELPPFVFNFLRTAKVRLKIGSVKVGIKKSSSSHHEKSSKVVPFPHLKTQETKHVI